MQNIVLPSIIVLAVFCNLSLADTSKSSASKKYVLTQTQWSVPRDAISVLSMPAVHSTMQQFSMSNNQSLVVRYPGGEVGMLWASELKGWLISLGLSSDRIETQAGSLNLDELELHVTNKK